MNATYQMGLSCTNICHEMFTFGNILLFNEHIVISKQYKQW